MFFNKTTLKICTLFLLSFAGCGGNNNTANNNQDAVIKTDNNEGANQNEDINYTLSYEADDGVLIEKYGNKDLTWVNSTGTICLKYRISNNISIYNKGLDYCNNLEFAGINTWRLPTQEEAIHFMNNVPINPNANQNINPNQDKNYLIYPDNGATCLFMATENSKDYYYVYTTNHENNGSFYAQNRQTAGIRCVYTSY